MNKTNLWKVPAYCMVSGFLCYLLLVRVGLGRLALVTLPDGAITADNKTWMLLSGILFLIVVAGGGALFRKLPRRDLFFSASILVGLNVLFGVLSAVTDGSAGFFWYELCEWDSVVSQLLNAAGVSPWVSAVLTWLLPPYIFVLFGKKSADGGKKEEAA